MKPVLSVLGVGVNLPPAVPVRALAAAAGASTDAYANWDNAGVAGDDDHPSTMGAAALRAALEKSGVAPKDLSLVISAGMSRDYLPSWSVAAEWIRLLGAPSTCAPLDLTAGCLGVLFALDLVLAKLAVRGGGYAAIVAAERMSYTIDRSDGERNTMWAYADGAAAIVVALDRPGKPVAAFHGAEFVSRGALNGAVLIKYGGTRHPIAPSGADPTTRVLAVPPNVNLREAYVEAYAEAIQALYGRFSERPQRLVCNQIAIRTVAMIGEVAGVPAENVVVTGHDTGHVGSADMLIGLDRVLGDGVLAESVLIAGSTPYVFGAGLITPPVSA
jgi:3-oxoacyl-[acyl-carrier-protein] synthase III